VELDEAHPLLDEPAGKKDVVGDADLPRLGAVHVEDLPRLARYIHYLGHRRLHPESELVLLDSSPRLGTAELGRLDLVEGAKGVEARPAEIAIHPLRVRDVEDRVPLRAALDPLIHRRQKAARPVGVPRAREGAAGDEDNEPREIPALGTET